MLAVGETPADFTLNDDRGNVVRWADFRGKPVVVFFYPRANTPGCTKEACAFRDLRPEFEKRGVVVLGMSADSVKSQNNFREKYDLTMPLIADPDKVVLLAWGVFGEKTMYGKKVQGIRRSTFLFDAAGKVVHAWENVRVEGHAEAVLAKVQALFSNNA